MILWLQDARTVVKASAQTDDETDAEAAFLGPLHSFSTTNGGGSQGPLLQNIVPPNP